MPIPSRRPQILTERLRAHLETLATIGADSAGGVSRHPYTEAHAQALRTVAGWMNEAGLGAGCDRCGNLIGVLSGSNGWPVIILASHLDSVPHGGMFDGALGVLAGVEVAQALRDAGYPLRHALTVVGFADEEGFAFGAGTLASRCVIGDISPAQFNALRGRDGRTLAETLEAFAPGLPPATFPAQVATYLELHIEQGPVLAQAGRRVAAVSAIAGITRTAVNLEGEANHAGTTPMAARRDALVGAAEAVLAVRSLVDAAGPPAVGTVGVLTVPSAAQNIVPGCVEFSVELRTPEADRLRRLQGQVEASITRIAQRRGLQLQMTPWDCKDPVPLDSDVQEAVATAMARAGCEPHTMPSGAGHDAMILARFVPAGMIFVPSVDGISHSPRERTEWADVALGAEVLLQTVLVLDERGPLPAHALPVT